MPSSQGGARSRSGPPKDESSLKSGKIGYFLMALPASYDGPVPKFPLTYPTKREKTLWAKVWTFPQACAWSMPSEEWRIQSVAMYVRTLARCEDRKASPALFSALLRLAHEVGLTTAGLAAMGWKVRADDLAPKREAAEQVPRESSKSRLRSAPDASAGA